MQAGKRTYVNSDLGLESNSLNTNKSANDTATLSADGPVEGDRDVSHSVKGIREGTHCILPESAMMKDT